MTRFRTFKRTFWTKSGVPKLGRKTYTGHVNMTFGEANRACARMNLEAFGSERGRGPRGMAHEFESY